MRASEWIEIVYFPLLVALAWIRALPAPGRRSATMLGLVGLSSALIGSLSAGWLPAAASVRLRDWLPAPLILAAYRQAGHFFRAPDPRLERRLLSLDRRWLGWLRARWSLGRVASLGELAYALCYPMPPLGLAALVLLGRPGGADLYWSAVLAPTFACYLATTWLPTRPPRHLPEDPFAPPAGRVRSFNVWLLRGGAIPSNTLPSGHVAASMGVALALLDVAPTAGLVALALAAGIAAGAVLGRYHYLADVVLGAVLAIGWFPLARLLAG